MPRSAAREMAAISSLRRTSLGMCPSWHSENDECGLFDLEE